MTGGRLIFYGLAWPAAQAVRTQIRKNVEPAAKPAPGSIAAALESLKPPPSPFEKLRNLADAFPQFGKPPAGETIEWSQYPLIEARSGQGRPWLADSAEGFWRDFAGIDLSDAGGVVAFVRRRGDPEGLLNRPGASADVSRWLTPLQGGLRRFAACWSEPDADGVSRRAGDSRDAVEFWRLYLFPSIKAQVEVIPAPDDGASLALSVNTLGAFMALSAAGAFERRVAMRRCQYCSSWFEVRRKDMRFCSATCRAALSNSLKERGER